ncbi:hypothetical protein PRK78_004059 [Emydomyces testavorans]|uniref:Uncharacterized protein n=1 Tax=Emydomyces testavorans TaxID=2070801 RepID=A0AAF0DH56_9EURO|nr:hypothetical protein PRK78_004059 [Emydomyces testavorans]
MLQSSSKQENRGRTSASTRGTSKRNRCEFFLWDDEAKRRSGQALLAGSRSEAVNARDDTPKTPAVSRVRDITHTGLLTPETGQKKRVRSGEDDITEAEESPSKTRRVGERKVSSFLTRWLNNLREANEQRELEEDDALFGWNEEMDEEAVDLMTNRDETQSTEHASAPAAHVDKPAQPEHLKVLTPRKGSYPQSSLQVRQQPAMPPALENKAAALSPRASRPSVTTNHVHPPQTPTPIRFTSSPFMNRYPTRPPPQEQYCKLISQTLTLLETHHISLPPDAKHELISLLDTYDLRTLGIIKGRDVSRMAIKSRDEKIQDLLERIECLEAEREAWRAGVVKEHVDRKQDTGPESKWK